MASRSYTPPTCTLKVRAKGLTLLAWIGLPKRQQFTLSFDDPRIPEAEHLTIKGNRAQLNTLHKVVTTYIQEFLNNSPNLPLDMLEMESRGVENDGTSTSQYSNTKIQENISVPITDSPVSIPNSELPKGNQEIYLQPRGLLTHDLFLGALSNKESGDFISLSMIQLFDLAIALDECQTDLQTLPQFQSDGEVKTIPEWLRSAVLIMITAGMTVGAIQLYDRYAISKKPQDETIASDPTIDNNQPLPPQVSPSVTPLPTPSSPFPPPPTNLPTPTTSPIPIIKPSPIQTPSPLFPQPNSAPPPPANLPPPPTDFSPTLRPNQGGAATVVIPAAPSLTAPPVPPPTIPNYGGIPAQPRPPVPANPNLQIPTPPPSNQPPPQISRRGVRPFVDVTRIPVNVPEKIDLPPLADVPPTIAKQEEDATVSGDQAAVDPNQSGNSSKSKYPLFDKIPQVVEVREYFQSSWKPPQDLDRNLQYSLLLNSDGSVEKVIPIGIASVEFYGNTNMPLEETFFVSKIEGGKNAKIRVILSPDGEVMTFLESLN
ncbi:MAG: DUF4335 domain-containing protein [Microcoleaceae cyanobacterium MO_207.B10]|nr:DUF4335 domain-containing protein [Microcoleaceae cyanobacterium MO_207.B10]